MSKIEFTDNYKGSVNKKGEESRGNCGIYSNKKDLKISNITLEDYKFHKSNTIFSFFNDSEKQKYKNDDKNLIISIKNITNENGYIGYYAQTGNYVGKFNWNGVEIDIKSRFSDSFLKRMLNFVNNIFLDDLELGGKQSKNLDFSKYIIYYLFVQSLKKASLIGFPKSYKTIKNHDIVLKGSVDINNFIKKEIPFKGKVSSKYKKLLEVQEIIDILNKTVSIIGKDSKELVKSINNIKNHLKQNKSNQKITFKTFNDAKNSKALHNPMFKEYKKVLGYAQLIIKNKNLEESNKKEEKYYGFLINIAELFEIYITKLLQRRFPDWQVESPKIELHERMFYQRKIIPDIVMSKDNYVMVFDTKYKKMKFRGKKNNNYWDLDRNDFFQINTYMSYYNNKGKNIIAGGLLYPIEAKYNEEECLDNWFSFDNKNTKFIVDGIDLSDLEQKGIIERENEFLERIQNLFVKSK